MFYIYDRSSTKIMGKMAKSSGEVLADPSKSYKTLSAALAARTRMSKRYRADLLAPDYDPQYCYGVAEAKYFHSTIELHFKKPQLDCHY
jgi:hypothetical protein